MVALRYPDGIKTNPGFWLNPRTLWASRRKLFRRDNSNQWRKSFLGHSLKRHPDRSVPFSEVLRDPEAVHRGFRLLILGDTGEGDRSQYGLLPVIRALEPQMVILNGDVAYPAGRDEDFRRGFFRPYRNLGVPIWAVPGNHEYYSQDKGRTFFQVFCTHHYAGWWTEHGLPLVPQPGTYWELREPSGDPPLTLVAIDTGMAGDLDGTKASHDEDRAQHEWLRSRLARSEDEGRRTIVLFHIPGLVDERHQEKTHLSTLHRIVAASPAVGLVICGHVHNHQFYSPETFRRYLREKHAASVPDDGRRPPSYVVSGGGGAYLSEPRKARDGYPAEFFPSPEEWRGFAGGVERAVSNVGLGKAAAMRLASGFNASMRGDGDAARFLSLVVIDAAPGSIEVRQLLMDDLNDLFPHLGEAFEVRVDDPKPPVDPGALRTLLNRRPALRL